MSRLATKCKQKPNFQPSECQTYWLRICHTSGLLIQLLLTLGHTHTDTHTCTHAHTHTCNTHTQYYYTIQASRCAYVHRPLHKWCNNSCALQFVLVNDLAKRLESAFLQSIIPSECNVSQLQCCELYQQIHKI